MMENKTQKELVDYCKTNGIRGYSGKNKDKLIKLIKEHEVATNNADAAATTAAVNGDMLNTIVNGDAMQILPTMESNIAQIIIAQPIKILCESRSKELKNLRSRKTKPSEAVK